MTRHDDGISAVVLFVLTMIILVAAACGDMTGPPEPPVPEKRLQICHPVDTVHITLYGRPAIMVFQRCY